MVKPFHKHKNKNIDEITSEFHQEWFHQLGQECESMNVEEWQGLESKPARIHIMTPWKNEIELSIQLSFSIENIIMNRFYSCM